METPVIIIEGIDLSQVSGASRFVSVTCRCLHDIKAFNPSGTNMVDAKSLMGLYALDLTNPITIKIYGAIDSGYEAQLRQFVRR